MTTTIAVPRWPSVELAEAAADAWGFNCGPAALCAVTGLTPDEIRRHLKPFRGFMAPTDMVAALRSLGLTKRKVYRSDSPGDLPVTERLALARIQWGGPWCKPGVPFAACYRQTHWIAILGDGVYDVNVAGWISRSDWASKLVPWLLREAVKRADGTWWPTHVWEVSNG